MPPPILKLALAAVGGLCGGAVLTHFLPIGQPAGSASDVSDAVCAVPDYDTDGASGVAGVAMPEGVTLGGPFSLVDHRGRPFTQAELLGKWSLLYFGFAHCPDVCPEQLEKISELARLVPELQPVFVTVDPFRDSCETLRGFLADFDPRVVGLTGTPQQVQEVCDRYRVYHSLPGDLAKGYVVDHSVVSYLFTPAGRFASFFPKDFTAEQCADVIARHMRLAQRKGGGLPNPS